MSGEYIGVIRRGWQDATATLAPHVVGLSDVLEQRLEEAIRTGSLDETTLLGIVDSATQMAVDSGAADVAHNLSKRLRRTVYEYLLSLDATSPEESSPLPQALAVSPSGAGLIGADEVAALGRVGGSETSTRREYGEPRVDFSEPAWAASLGTGSSNHAATSRFGVAPEAPQPLPSPEPEPDQQRRLYLFQGNGDAGAQTVHDLAPDNDHDHDAGAAGGSEPAPDAASAPASVTDDAQLSSASPGPGFGFHIGDPNDLVGQAPPGEDESANPDDQNFHAFPADLGEFESVTPGRDELPPPPRASFADPSTWPKPVTPTLRAVRSQEPVEPHPDAGETSGGHGVAGFEHLSRWTSPWPNRLRPDTVAEQPEAAEPVPEALAAAEPEASAPSELPNPAALAPSAEPLSIAPVQSELLRPTPDVSPLNTRLEVEEVPESDLSELRTAIDEKLRKKRCDDAAAMLQQVAQEVGGRLVAEMALDAGDRCRALGKANAALNCYLAASRADPVYEAPLARLADICIDDQDIDLAVSYLERIARLTRLRGDNKGALRIYRKIATIAPYRDDVLEMLMRAQTTGRFDS